MRRITAALTLFTRIPVWRWTDIPAAAYSSAVVFWPLTGWITGGVAALTVWLLSMVMPLAPAVACALVARLILTGALHEDGLADFCDGFGGGRDKEGILRIMKDSHIGTYGVIGLICWFLLVWSLLSSLSADLAALALLAADPMAKCCASQLTNLLPYARPEGAKNKISYSRMSVGDFLFNVMCGILPIVPLFLVAPLTICAVVFPIAAMALMVRMMRRRIDGYTGDCCGATFLVCEASMLVGIIILINL